MIMTAARAIAFVGCLVCVCLPTYASDPPARKAVRLDAVGDPLPDRAVARLGTLRLVHRGGVSAVAVSPDGKLLASGVSNPPSYTSVGTSDAKAKPMGIRLWDVQTGRLIRELHTPDDSTSSLLFSVDGADLYGASGHHLACWDPNTGKKRWETPLQNGNTELGLSVSKLVLAGDRLVSVHAGNLRRSVSGDGWSISTAHSQKAVRVWNRKTGAAEKLPAALESTTADGVDIPVLFHDLAISSDARFIAVITSYARSPKWLANPAVAKGKMPDEDDSWQYPNPRFRVVEIGTGTIRHDFLAASIVDTHMTFSDDGSFLAIGAGKEIWLLEVGTGRKTHLARGVPGIRELRFLTGLPQLAARLDDHSIRVWDYKTCRAIEPHSVRNYHLHAKPDRSIVAIGRGNAIRLFERDTGKPILDFAGHHEVPAIRFGPADVLGSWDSEQVYRWDAGNWNAHEHMRIQSDAEPGLGHFHQSHWSWIFRLNGPIICPEKGLRLHDDPKALILHDLRTGKLVRTLNNSGGEERSSFFSKDGSRIISMDPKRIASFDVATGKRLGVVDNPLEPQAAIWRGLTSYCPPIVSPMGTFLASSEKCAELELMRLDTGKRLPRLSADKGTDPDMRFAILQLWFSPDERFAIAEVHRHLASGGETVELAIWDVERGVLVQEMTIDPRMQVWHRSQLQIHSASALAMSPDHRLIALARRYHGEIEIWDTASATRRGVLSRHEGEVSDLAFSQDGRYLASASDDTTILVWDMNRPWQSAASNDKIATGNLAATWQSLSEPDAARADTAIWQMVEAKGPAIAFLKDHLKPQARPDRVHMRRLLDDLDSDDFDKRSQAQTELENYRELVLGDLKAAQAQKGSLEWRRRIERLAAVAERAALPFGTPERLREWRAMEVLERIGSPDAVALLQSLASGAPASPLTVQSAEVLARLRASKK